MGCKIEINCACDNVQERNLQSLYNRYHPHLNTSDSSIVFKCELFSKAISKELWDEILNCAHQFNEINLALSKETNPVVTIEYLENTECFYKTEGEPTYKYGISELESSPKILTYKNHTEKVPISICKNLYNCHLTLREINRKLSLANHKDSLNISFCNFYENTISIYHGAGGFIDNISVVFNDFNVSFGISIK